MIKEELAEVSRRNEPGRRGPKGEIDYFDSPEAGGTKKQFGKETEEEELTTALAQWAADRIERGNPEAPSGMSYGSIEDTTLQIVKDWMEHGPRFAMKYADKLDDEELQQISGRMYRAELRNPAYTYKLFLQKLKDAKGSKFKVQGQNK